MSYRSKVFVRRELLRIIKTGKLPAKQQFEAVKMFSDVTASIPKAADGWWKHKPIKPEDVNIESIMEKIKDDEVTQ